MALQRIRKPTPRPRPVAKDIAWMGSSKADLCEFPDDIKAELGRQLRKIQFGEQPDSFDSLPIVGAGSYEIRIRDADGWYRVIYVAKFDKAVYALHSFKKKTNETSQSDINLAKARYQEAKKDASR